MSSRSRIFSRGLVVIAVLVAGCESSVPQMHAGPPAPARLFDVRHQVDAVRGRVWWLRRDGVFVHDLSRTDRAEVRLPGWQVAGEPYACLPDLALGPRGDAFVTSNVSPVVWRIDARTLAVTEHRLELDSDLDKDVGFSGLVYSPAHDAFFAASDAHGTLWRIDPQLTVARKVAIAAPIRGACALAVGSHVATWQAAKSTSLCVQATGGDWIIDVARDQRSAYLRAMSCTALPVLIAGLPAVRR
jgi:hypothetical protein